MMECKDKSELITAVYVVNYEDVKVKNGIVSIKRKYKEKKRQTYKIK